MPVRPRPRSVWLILLLPLAASCSGLRWGQDMPRVRMDLEAAPQVVAAGGETQLLVRFRIPRGWHLYWSNPGDSGLPPGLSWSLPEGWSVDKPAFPVPREHVSEAGRSWIHKDELVLRVPLWAPAGLEPGERFPIRLEADWLACREACVPGRSSAHSEVRAADLPTSRRPQSRRLPGEDQQPQAWSHFPVTLGVDSSHLVLDFPGWWEAPARGWWLPEEPGWLDESAGCWSRDSQGARWRQPLSAWGEAPPDTLRGLLLDLDHPGRGWSLEFPLPGDGIVSTQHPSLKRKQP